MRVDVINECKSCRHLKHFPEEGGYWCYYHTFEKMIHVNISEPVEGYVSDKCPLPDVENETGVLTFIRKANKE